MKILFEIRYGREAKMYTLWRVVQPTDKNERYSEHYCYNLSTDYDTAVSKTKEKAEESGLEFVVDAPENLNEIKRGDDVFRFGKYRDKRVSDIDDDRYLTWVWKGGFVKDGNDWKQIIDRNEPICRHAEEVLLNKGVLVVYNDRVLTAKRAEELKELTELNSKSDYVGSEGDKLELKVKVEKIIHYDSMYGITWITIMRTEDGNVVVYKGKYLDKNEGDEITIKGTVKEHSEYNGTKQTRLQRVKVVK